MSEINANIVVSPIDLNVTVSTNQLTFTPDAISLNIYAGGVGSSNSLNANIANVHIYGGTNGYVLQTDGTGNLAWTAQTGNGGGNGSPGGSNTQVQYNDSGSFGGTAGFTFDSVTTNLNVPGNVTAPYFIGNASFATFAAAATTVTASSQPNITSVGSLVSLTVIGNSNTGNIYTSGPSGNISGANVITANTFVGNLTGVATNATVAGTVYTNAQPNITSVGTLTGLTSNGVVNFSNTSNVSLGAVGNVKITGGTANYVLKTDGAGNLSWVAQSGGGNASSIANGNSNVNIATSAGAITMAVNGTAIVTVSSASVTSKQFISNVAIGTAPFVVTSTTLVANLRAQSASTANAVTGANITTDWVNIGSNAVANTTLYSIAIGANASAEAYRAVSIGYQAGTNVAGTYDVISIGWKAGRLIQSNAIAIGAGSGNVANSYSISIGKDSGYYAGANTISIGYQAGFGTGGAAGPANTIAIGLLAGNSAIHANSIILNASGVDLPSTQANSLFVKPIRDVTGNVDFTKTLKYNPTTGEIGYV
jgi:hypothetical protein